MNYSTKPISNELKTLAIKIKNEVPYWLHYRPILALKKSLKTCHELEANNNTSNTLQMNKILIIECLRVFRSLETNTFQDHGNSIQE